MVWDWMNKIPVVSNIWGSDLVQGDLLPMVGLQKSPEEQALLDQMRRTSTDYEQYRPQVAQARMNALRQGFELMSPYTRAMEQMYGPVAAADYSQLSSPMDPIHQPQQPATVSQVSGGEPPGRPSVRAMPSEEWPSARPVRAR